MTERRMTTDPAAEHDKQVSETYRDIAHEGAPDELNRAILDAARREARPRYARLRVWTRPAAWAAVVMLSVALLIETNQAPDPDSLAPAIQQDSPQEAADRAVSAEPDPKAQMQMRKSDPGAAGAREPADGTGAILERAQEMARMTSGTGEELPGCDETARATPESWLDCIARLEESGALDAAQAEREQLAEAFPDFDAP